MHYRSDFPASRHLLFGGPVLPDTFEDRLLDYYATGADVLKPVLVDFRDASFIDIATLVNCIAFAVSRRELKAPTYIGVSADKAVRDFMRTWRFPEAFLETTGQTFEDALVLDDHKYRGEAQTTYTGQGDTVDSLEHDSDWVVGYPTRRNFFEFFTYTLHPSARTPLAAYAIPRSEGQRWNAPQIQHVLRSHLASSEPSDDVARVVIYESLSNAVRHPKATVILAVSKFDRAAPSTRDDSVLEHRDIRRSTGHLRICVWDDGMPITETLLPLIRSGQRIRHTSLPRYMYDDVLLTVRTHDRHVVSRQPVNQGADPAPDASDEVVLLSSLFPGISRATVQEVPQTDPYEQTGDQWFGAQGMGLYALMKTALDMHQGKLFIRTGKHRMTVELAHDAYRIQYRAMYKATITRLPDPLPTFKGNLLIIHLPVTRIRI